MAALDELHHQCERRGWRLLLTGTSHYPDGTIGPCSLPAKVALLTFSKISNDAG